MESDFKILINQVIRVTRTDGKDDWYISSVQDLDNNNFYISIPTQGSHPLILNNGDKVKILLITGTSRFEFETLMMGQRQDNVLLYVMSLPKEYKRIQQREFVRIPIIMEIYYTELPEEGQLCDFIRGSSLDLSGGGIRFLSNNAYPVNTSLLLKFTLPFRACSQEMEVMGKVVRSSLVENVNRYHIVAKFVKISRRKQDLIVRFILMRLSEQNHLR